MADDLDTLIKDLAFAEAAPDEAMRKAVPHARTLAPRIAALAKKRIEGAWLYPAEDNLLFYGLFVMAAARARPMWPIWIELLKGPEAGILFGEGPVVSVASITLGLFEKDAPAIAQLIERPETSPDVRAGLLFALTRLTCEDAYARADFVALIDRLARGQIGERGKRDLEEAIILGGVEERADLLKQFWRADAVSGHEKSQARSELRAAAAEPSALARFDERGIAAPADPAAPLSWFMPLESEQDPVREDAALSWRECDKLEGVFKRCAGRAEPMRFEQLDGLAHALVLGPELVLPSECAAKIWGEDGPQFEGPLEARTCLRLIERHWNAIAARAEEEDLASPWLEAQPKHAPGQLWGRGFAAGVPLREKAWLMDADHAAARALGDVLLLERGDLEAAKRMGILRGLGDLVAQIAGYWRVRRGERL